MNEARTFTVLLIDLNGVLADSPAVIDRPRVELRGSNP